MGLPKLWIETLNRLEALETKVSCLEAIVKDYFAPKSTDEPDQVPQPETKQALE